MGTKLSPRAVQERWDLEHMEKKKMLASNLVIILLMAKTVCLTFPRLSAPSFCPESI